MKAITLISGGLDSILAARLIQKLGIDPVPISFEIPFSCPSRPCIPKSDLVKDALNKELFCVNIEDDFFEILKNPIYGFGSNMNPCIDCKILMLKKAGGLLGKFQASFVVTGEVLGQRPMSQNKQMLSVVPRRAALEGLVLRPLSARLLPETIPEKEGWVNRQMLLAFSGRGRREQILMAKEFGITKYSQPAGGCLLTDPDFSKRVRDLIEHGELTLDNLRLLKLGRHFRLSRRAKLIVGRDETENTRLGQLAMAGDIVFMPEGIAGPLSLGRGEFDRELAYFSSRIACRYSDLGESQEAQLSYRMGGKTEVIAVKPLAEDELRKLRI